MASNINDVILSADQQAIVGLIAKMGVDRALTSSIQDAREAFLNAVVDILSAYSTTQNAVQGVGGGLIAPANILQMLPVYVHGLLRGVSNDTIISVLLLILCVYRRASALTSNPPWTTACTISTN